MGELASRIWDNPVMNYLLSFGGLGGALMLCLNWLHGKLRFSDRTWAFLTLGCGATGGIFIQELGWVQSPATGSVGAMLFAAFVGAIVACAAASFSTLDMRASVMRKKKNED